MAKKAVVKVCSSSKLLLITEVNKMPEGKIMDLYYGVSGQKTVRSADTIWMTDFWLGQKIDPDLPC
jgi:hypothetical protein